MSVPAGVLDPELPGLAAALDPAFMSPRLASLPGITADARVVGVEPVKHRPGRRCALVYTIEGPRGRRRLFAKTFKNKRGAAILAQMRRFSEALSAAADADREVVVPRPLGYLPEVRMVVTEFLEGPLLALKLYEGPSGEPARRMAAAVRELHACGVGEIRPWRIQDELSNTERWVASFGDEAVVRDRVGDLLAALRRRGSRLPVAAERPIHRDFYPEQILDLDGATALLDLDDARLGDPALDLGNFLAHLTLRTLQFPRYGAGCSRGRDDFLDAYGLPVGESERTPFLERVRFYEAATLLRLVGVYASRELWAATLPFALLEACKQLSNTWETER